jgi:hypothetical protein
MKYSNDCNTVIGSAKVNHMPLNTTAAVTLANMVPGWNRLWRFSQCLKCRDEQVGLTLCLFHTPLFVRVSPNAFQVALRDGRESILSHASGGAFA